MSIIDGDRLMEDGGKVCGDVSHRLCPEEEVLDVEVRAMEAVGCVAKEQEQQDPLPKTVTTKETRGSGDEGGEEAREVERELVEVTTSPNGVVVLKSTRPE